jgi:hypothetical protein
VRQAELQRVLLPAFQAGIVRQAAARPQRQAQTALEVEERHRAVLVFGADDALGIPAEAVAVEADGAPEVVHGKSDERDARLHL